MRWFFRCYQWHWHCSAKISVSLTHSALFRWVNSNLSWLQEPKNWRPLLTSHHSCSELSADPSKGCGFGVFFPLEWWNKISLCPPTGQFQTAALEAFSMVELPYLGEKLSMFLVLPSHKRTPLSQIESHLSAKTITLWANSLKRTKMDIFLPR